MPRQERAPMLAHSYDPKKVVFPCVIQPKLDGIRCLAYVNAGNDVELRSRDDKPINMPHVKLAVQWLKLPEGTVLDGELYKHGLPFQELSGHVRREQWDARKSQIEYHVYDVINEPAGSVHLLEYPARHDWLRLEISEGLSTLRVVEARIITNAEDVQFFERRYVDQGYEGAMVRTGTPSRVTKKNPDVTVTPDFYEAQWHGGSRRSWFLQKVKTFDDAEAIITGVEEEVSIEGQPKGRAGKFVLITPEGVVFRASGLVDTMKEDAWANPEKYIGQVATYTYFGTSLEGTPRHPNFKALRPAGELDEAV